MPQTAKLLFGVYWVKLFKEKWIHLLDLLKYSTEGFTLFAIQTRLYKDKLIFCIWVFKWLATKFRLVICWTTLQSIKFVELSQMCIHFLQTFYTFFFHVRGSSSNYLKARFVTFFVKVPTAVHSSSYSIRTRPFSFLVW